MGSLADLGYPVGQALIDEYKRRYCDTTLLSFSRGKDSIAVALALRDKINVVPITFITIPGLTFIDESLDYFERKLFKRPILRMPHPSLYRNLNSLGFQTYESANVVLAAELPEFDRSQNVDLAKRQEGITENVLTAVGMRAADSALRQMSMRRHGPFRPKQGSWCPVWDWNKERLITEIEKAGLHLPIDYLMFGRSFDGIDASFIVPLKRDRPDDYQKLVDFYPLLDVEIFYYELHQKTGDAPVKSPRKWTEAFGLAGRTEGNAGVQGRQRVAARSNSKKSAASG